MPPLDSRRQREQQNSEEEPEREPEVPSQDDDESAHAGAKMVAFCAAFVMVLTYHLDPPPLPPA